MSRSSAKQYTAICAAGMRLRITPSNPRRTMLFIQNTGVNAGTFRFENSVQNDGGDVVLASFDSVKFDVDCPIEALNLYSTLGTTFAVIEGMFIDGPHGQ